MSKEIIYLEPDEEITSIIDKLRVIKDTKSVFLVAPKDATITQSVVNLKILKKEAENLGLEVGLVSQENIARNIASQVGLSVYESINSQKPIIEPQKMEPNLDDMIEIDMSEEKPLKPPPGVNVNYYSGDDDNSKNIQKKPKLTTHSQAAPISSARYNEPIISRPKKPNKWLAKIAFVLIGIVVFGFLFYYFYPKANIDLVIKSTPIEENIEITIDTSLNKVSDDNKSIPGEILTFKDNITQEFNATGKKDVGEKAKGTVTLSNGTGAVVDVSSGTKLESSDGYIFIATSSVSVPAATATVDASGNVAKNPGTTNISVESEEAGDKYNIGSSSFTVYNHSNVSGSSSSSFSGGVSKQITIVSKDDIKNAETKLESELHSKIKDNLISQSQDKKLSLLADSIDYYDKKFSTDKNSGDETQKFNATISVSAKTIAFTEDNYRQNIIAALGDKVPSDKELILTSDDEISQGGYTVDYSQGVMKIEGTIKTKLAPKINYDQLKNELKGKSVVSAENYLKNKPELTEASVNINPSWIKNIPKHTKNIIFKQKYQNSQTDIKEND